MNNDMFMNGLQGSDSHRPLMVYIRRQRNFERSQEYLRKKQAWIAQEHKDYNKQWGQKRWKDYSASTWNDYGDYGSQSSRVYIALYITLVIRLGIPKEIVHSVFHFESQNISSEQKRG